MRRPLTLALALTASAAAGADLTCTSHGFCDTSLTCGADQVDLAVRDQPDGTVAFGFTEARTFAAAPVAHDGFTSYTAADDAALVTLSIGPDLQATLSLVGIDEGRLYTAIQVLTCRSAE